MKMEKHNIIILLTFILGSIVFVSSSFINYARSPFTPGFGLFPTLNSTDRDKAELIKLTLERAIVDKEIPEYESIKDKRNIVLSTENIRKELVVPSIKGVKIIVLGADEIQDKADREGHFSYFRFSRLDLQNSEYAVVELWVMYTVSKDSDFGTMGGMGIGGFVLCYKKVSGHWEGDLWFKIVI